MPNLKDIFTNTLTQSGVDLYVTNLRWNEIEVYYTHPDRYYHNLIHLQQCYNELAAIKSNLEDWECVKIALFYHDVIYKAQSNKNEEESAQLAKLRMKNFSWSNARIERCISHILSTKWHSYSDDNDSNYFTDADLSILGNSPSIYSSYCWDIRKEYSIYPDFIYRPGRRKVLKHFLEMDRIFKTQHFYDLYEAQARANLLNELSQYT
jgi:predicted metal-dependent HD superfamily phosphohydrolase